MRQHDGGTAVENGVDGAEAQNLSFRPAGSGAVETGTDLAQGGIALVPEVSRLHVAGKAHAALVVRPIESVAKFSGDCGQVVRTQVTAIREALAALHRSPEATVGKAVVGFCGMEMLCEFALRDVGDEADMRPGCLDRPTAIERTQVATIPGTTEQGGKRAFGAPQVVENSGELFRECEQAAVCRGLLIAQVMEKGRGREAGAGDAFGDPGAIDFREETADLVPASPLAGLTGFADQHDEKIEAMASGIDQAMGAGTNGVAKGNQKLEKDGSRMSFGVRGESSCGRPGDTVEGGLAEYRVCG